MEAKRPLGSTDAGTRHDPHGVGQFLRELGAIPSGKDSDPERRAALGAAGPAVVESRYTVDKMVEGNLEVYRRLLAPAGTDRG